MFKFINQHRRLAKVFLLLIFAMILLAGGYAAAHLYIKKYGISLSSGDDIEPRYKIHYLQNDARWAQEKIGNSKYSMGEAGCLLTSVANVLSDLDIDITPQEVNEKLTEADGYLGADLIWYKLHEIIPETDYKYKRIFNGATIEKDLKNGLLPIVNVRFNKTGVTHWVVIVGAKDGDFLIIDPADRTLTPIPLATHGKVYAYRVIHHVL